MAIHGRIELRHYFLNQRPDDYYSYYYDDGLVHGVRRTMRFWGADSTRLVDVLRSHAYPYNGSGSDECGALALHFADEQFSWRDGANRIYLNFTDEPNQPYRDSRWSVESLNPNDTLGIYNWDPSRGTVHTVYSEPYDSLKWEEPNGSWYNYNKQSPYTYYECPWKMSEYTGGVTFIAKSNFSDVTLNGLEVTGAMSNSYILRFNVTDDLRTGLHTVEITIKDRQGNEAKKVFNNVSFELK